LILNFPVKKGTPTRVIDTSFLKPDDIIVITTRPPLNDEEVESKKFIARSHTSLEERVFDTLKPHLETSTRLKLDISQDLATHLPDPYANRALIEFFASSGATYRRYKRNGARKMQRATPPVGTALYLLYPPKLRSSDPAILCTFGMAGTYSLLWSYFLRTRFPERLDLRTPRFIMAEVLPEEIPQLPDNLSFADHWHVKFLIDTPL
jgi:hypothetical protein